MRAGNTIVITISISSRLAEVLEQISEEHDYNRSQFVASAVKERLERLGIEVKEND